MLRLILNFLEHVEVSFSAISSNVPILIKPLSHGPCSLPNMSWCLAFLWVCAWPSSITYSSFQQSEKQNFVMLLPSLGNEQHKVNKNIFGKGTISSKKNFYENKEGLLSLLFPLNTVILIFLSHFSLMFTVGWYLTLEDTFQPLIWEDLLQLERVTCPFMSGEFLGLMFAPWLPIAL